MKGLLLSFILTSLNIAVSAQTATLSIGSVAVCNDMEVAVPVEGTGLYDMAAMSLRIAVDLSAVEYIGLEAIKEEFEGLSYGLNTEQEPFIGIAWSNLIPVQINNEALFKIRFRKKAGESTLRFLNTCQLADINLNIIQADFIDGAIRRGETEIIEQPASRKVSPGTQVTFKIITGLCEALHWQESLDQGKSWSDLENTDIYQGVTSNELKISNPTKNFDGRKYRCRLTIETCSIYSEAASLTIDNQNSINDKEDHAFTGFSVLPVPVRTKLEFRFLAHKTGQVAITIFDCTGNQMNYSESIINTAGQKVIGYDFTDMRPGFYFYRFSFKSETGLVEIKTGKIVR